MCELFIAAISVGSSQYEATSEDGCSDEVIRTNILAWEGKEDNSIGVYACWHFLSR